MANNKIKAKSEADIVDILLAEAVRNEKGCMISTRARDYKGYAKVGVGGRGIPTQLAHRLVHRIIKGESPKEKPLVLHTCDERACINPTHLYAGTAADNTRDMMIRKRGANGTHRGY